MSLYNVLFGENEDTPVLLGMLNVNKAYFDRFRDVYLFDNGKRIRVYTRLGGENRKNYEETWNKIKNHKNYSKDFDDDFDNTYAYIDFSIPEEYIITAEKMFKEEPLTVSEMFHNEVEEMDVPGSKASNKAEEIAKIIMNAIENGDNFIGF
jgi:hypothetical protein